MNSYISVEQNKRVYYRGARLFVVEMNICLFPMHNITSLKAIMCRIPDMVSLTSINSLNINMMKIKRYLLSTFCLCLFTACDSDDNLLCYGTHTEIEGDVTTFGAVGDGKTDCSKAINSAIASLPSEGE